VERWGPDGEIQVFEGFQWSLEERAAVLTVAVVLRTVFRT